MKTYIRARETETGVRFKVRENENVFFEDIPFSNYFYIQKSDYDAYLPMIKAEAKYIKSVDVVQARKRVFIKITFRNNFDRYKLKSKFELQGITLYEADIQAHKRFLIDNPDFKLGSEGLKWLMYDIETKDDSPLEKDMRGAIIAREPILSIAYKDQDGNEYYIKNSNQRNPIEGERELLKFHMKVIQQFDIILGWNSYRFDDTYIKQRNEFHRIDNTPWDFINQVDYMELVKKNLFPRIPSYSLDNTSKHILKDEKIEIQEKGNGGILELWRRSFEGDNTLEEYNKKDVDLMFKMEQKLGFISLHMIQCDYVGIHIQETIHNSEIWDMMLLKDYKEAGLIAPTKPNEEEKERRKNEDSVAGAFTFCLNPGVHSNVEVFDFKSFYPTTGTACNICMTTLISKEKAIKENIPYTTIPADTHTLTVNNKPVETHFGEKYFRLDKRGILANRFDELINLREFSKKEKWKYKESDPEKFQRLESEEWNYKTLANSGYGVVGQKVFRFFVEDCANAITQFCRHVIKKCVELATKEGFLVVQGDTDSIMFKNVENKITKEELEIKFADYFDEFAKQYNINSKEFEHKDLRTGEKVMKPHFIVFEHEKTFDRMISIMKKNYADLKQDRDGNGNPIGEPKISITGLECIKKDTNPLAVEFQKRLITEVLYEKQDINKFLKDLRELKQQFLENKVDPKYLIMKKSINKNIDEYGKPMIDSKTGMPKLKKNGTMRYAPIPAHVKLAQRLIDEGHDIYTGDQIAYIVQETGPIVAISVDEYSKGETYDREYYWERIVTPVLKVLFVTNPDVIIHNATLWKMKDMTEKQAENFVNRLKKKLEKEEEQ